MSPVTHFMLGWLLAQPHPRFEKRERLAVVIAAVAPDMDGLGIIAQWATMDTREPLMWYDQFHHLLGHNLLFGVTLALLLALSTRQRPWVFLFALISFHIHLLADIAGSRGSDPGDQWPIPYLQPFTNAVQLTWSGQWQLVSWPNTAITALALATIFYLAIKKGFSPLEMISEKVDRAFVSTLRTRFLRTRP